MEIDQVAETKNSSEPKPPPIYIPGLKNLKAILSIIGNNVDSKDYTYKIINQNQMKLQIAKNLKEAKVDFHTYQMKKYKHTEWFSGMCITQ